MCGYICHVGGCLGYIKHESGKEILLVLGRVVCWFASVDLGCVISSKGLCVVLSLWQETIELKG